MAERTTTDLIVLHCAATKPSMMHVDEHVIRHWHLERGWSDAGYNVVIPRRPITAGMIEIARPLDWRGAHAEGYNDRALGICLAGGMSEAGTDEDNFLPEQMAALATTIIFLLEVYPYAVIAGHEALDPRKTCPVFDWRSFCRRHDFEAYEV